MSVWSKTLRRNKRGALWRQFFSAKTIALFPCRKSSVTCRMCVVSCTSTPQSLSFKSDWGAIMRHARSPIRCLRPIGTGVTFFYRRHIFSLSVFLVRQLRPQSIQFRRVLVVLYPIFSLVPSLFTLHILSKYFYRETALLLLNIHFHRKHHSCINIFVVMDNCLIARKIFTNNFPFST